MSHPHPALRAVWSASPLENYGAIVAPHIEPQMGAEAYGGFVVCESISERSDPEMHRAVLSTPLILRALARVLESPYEPDKWRDDTERVLAYALGFEGTVRLSEFHAVRKLYITGFGVGQEPTLPLLTRTGGPA